MNEYLLPRQEEQNGCIFRCSPSGGYQVGMASYSNPLYLGVSRTNQWLITRPQRSDPSIPRPPHRRHSPLAPRVLPRQNQLRRLPNRTFPPVVPSSARASQDDANAEAQKSKPNLRNRKLSSTLGTSNTRDHCPTPPTQSARPLPWNIAL